VTPTAPQHLTFIVHGEAVPQGSMKAFVPKGWNRAVLTSDNSRMKPWRAMVASAALDAQYTQPTWPTVSDKAIGLHIACYFVRPASVSPKKRPHHTVKPDSSKLLRAIEDALTKVLWKDDSQVVSTTITKEYARPDEPARVLIHVWELDLPTHVASVPRHAAALPLEGVTDRA
jgi:Holliday junction resolvase RusA-like endonuclease